MFKHGFNCAVTVLYIPTQNLEDLPVVHAGPKLEELSSVCQKNCPMYVGRIVRCISEELACVCRLKIVTFMSEGRIVTCTVCRKQIVKCL